MWETIRLSVVFIVSVFLWIGLGGGVLERLRLKTEDRILDLVLAYLFGVFIFIFGLVGLGMTGRLDWKSLVIYILIIALFFGRRLFKGVICGRPKYASGSSKIARLLTTILVVLAVSNYFVCFAPPYIWDEVAYHLPESMSIVINHKIQFPVLGNLFYGNLPVSMELLSATGIILTGTPTMGHVWHYSILVCLVAVIYVFVRKRSTKELGLLAGIVIFLISDLVNNATTGYVDGAAISTEIIGLLLVTDWYEFGNVKKLYLAAGVWGMSLGIKYSGLYTIPVYMLIVLLGSTRWKYGWRKWVIIVMTMTVMGLAMGGFWYIKNLIMWQNPIYPYFFGLNTKKNWPF